MKLLITGGTGLVGTGIKSIASEFPEFDISYMSSKDCDLLDYDDVLEYFWKNEPECIIHLAANVGGLYKNMNQKVEMFDDNIQMNLNVIKAAFSNGIKNLIGTLSTCIFPVQTVRSPLMRLRKPRSTPVLTLIPSNILLNMAVYPFSGIP